MVFPRSCGTQTSRPTLAIYTHVDGIEDMRTAVAKLDFGPLKERAPAPVVPLRKTATFATGSLFPKSRGP